MVEIKETDDQYSAGEENTTSQTNQSNEGETQKKNNTAEGRWSRINWNFAPIKAHYFFLYGGMGGTVPYMQLLAKDFGITSTAVGIIYTVIPLCVCLSKPLFGFITDKFRNIRTILLALLITTAVAYYATLFLPPFTDMDSADMQITSTCMGEGSELIIDPPSYNSACAQEIANMEFECNLHSANCSKAKNVPGILNVSSALPAEKNITLSFTFNFKESTPSRQDCDCLKRNSSHLNCEPIISKCEFFKNIKKTSEYKSYSFWIFVLLSLVGGTGSATAFCLADAACYEILSESSQFYGRQRLFGTISWGITTLASGYFNGLASAGSANTNYFPGFSLMLVFVGIDILILCKLPLKKASMSPNICKDVAEIFASRKTIVFSFGVYICGALAGLLWTYQFWYLTELGSSQLLLGLVAAVQCLLAEVPLFFFSGWFVEKFGHFYCLIAALAAYALRIGLYSVLENPWLVLPIELLHGVTYATFCAAMTLYAVDCAAPGTEATLLGILGGLFEGLGVATGSFLGGIGFDNMGGRGTFFAASMISIICVPFFTIAYKILQRSQGKLDLGLDLKQQSSEITNCGTDNRTFQK